jgi:hypothetical protein
MANLMSEIGVIRKRDRPGTAHQIALRAASHVAVVDFQGMLAEAVNSGQVLVGCWPRCDRATSGSTISDAQRPLCQKLFLH